MKRDLPQTEAVRQYEAEKARWIDAHPEATPQEYQAAMRAIAQRVCL